MRDFIRATLTTVVFLYLLVGCVYNMYCLGELSDNSAIQSTNGYYHNRSRYYQDRTDDGMIEVQEEPQQQQEEESSEEVMYPEYNRRTPAVY